MGILLIVIGIFVIISVFIYVLNELKEGSWKERIIAILDHTTDFVGCN